MLPEVAHHMGLVPLVWLGGLAVRGQRRGAEWWWLAVAFGISWVADTAAHWVDPDLVGNFYPVSQAAIVGLVFLARRDIVFFLAALLLAGLAAIAWRGPLGVDVLLRTVAWGAVVGVVVDRWALARLRTALLVYFGIGLLAWWAYAFAPSWWTWGVYQAIRLTGILVFCFAALRPGPALRVEAT